ncbi:hypothetical protein D3C72_2433900 [compost metagenome]
MQEKSGGFQIYLFVKSRTDKREFYREVLPEGIPTAGTNIYGKEYFFVPRQYVKRRGIR